MSQPPVTEIVELAGSREVCPFGSKPHPAQVAIRTGTVRGVCCRAHQRQAEADHAKALRIVGIEPAPGDRDA